MSRTELRRQWELRIADFRGSGQTQSEWCAANQINHHQLKYWLYKTENKKPVATTQSTKWVSVTVDGQVSEPKNTIQITIGDASIEVKSGFNPTLLTEVVRTLRSLC